MDIDLCISLFGCVVTYHLVATVFLTELILQEDSDQLASAPIEAMDAGGTDQAETLEHNSAFRHTFYISFR